MTRTIEGHDGLALLARVHAEQHRCERRAQAKGGSCRCLVIDADPHHPHIADAHTLARARAGERDAIAALWRIYQPQLLRLLSSKQARSPEDVASQVWIDVGRSIDRFEGDGNDFRRWIFTIANNRSIDGHRRANRHEVVNLDAAAPQMPAAGTEAAFSANESLEHALAIVRQLPPAAAEAVMLRVVFGLPVDDVAEIMGRSEGSVRVLVHRGLGRLRGLVGRRSPDPGGGDVRPDVTNEDVPAFT